MENNSCVRIISVIIAFAFVFIASKIKRNIGNIYYIDIRVSLSSFSISIYFSLLVFSSLVSKQYKFSLALIIFFLFFLLMGFLILLEYCKIDKKALIVKHNHQKTEEINIDEIKVMEFVRVTPTRNADPCIDIITYNDEHIIMKSNIENLEGFVKELRNINPDINIINNIPANKNIIESIIMLVFLYLSINKIIFIITHVTQE